MQDLSAVEQLERSLREANDAALRDLDLRDTVALEDELPRLQVWAGSGTGIEEIDDDSIAVAVRSYRHAREIDGVVHARLLCYGCVREVDGSRLIEEPQRFAALLEYVDRFRFFARAFRRCYRGLLLAYFAYDPEAEGSAAGRKAWEDLWVFLERRKSLLETPGSDPEWVTTLLENRNLLTRDPTSRYGMGALRGNYAAFDAVRSKLGIGDDSWLMRRLVLSVLQAAVQLSDTHFKSVVVRLLVLLAKHPLMLDYGLARVIDRYAASATHEAHGRLREVAVLNWGDPRVPANASHWAGVKPASREMVAGWMKGDPA